MTETKHELGEQVTCHRCYGVYADYDANAPDSEVFVLVATKELGDEVCKILNEKDYGLAFCDGWEWCKSYQTTDEVAEAKKIATTLTEALAQIGYEDLKAEHEGDEEDGEKNEILNT